MPDAPPLDTADSTAGSNLSARLPIVFMGTPELACASLQALLNAPDFGVLAVVTQPDRPKGRNLQLTPSPVKELALRSGLKVFQPQKARDEGFLEAMRAVRPELIAVAAFGQILPEKLLLLPRYGCINVHTSLLPKYRGAAPIQWAILNDDAETGVTIMKMDPGLDTGPILARQSTPILTSDDSQSLHNRLAELGADLLVRTVRDLLAGRISPHPQPAAGVSYARKIVKEDGLIDWNRPSRVIWNQIRALSPWPGAFTRLSSTEKNSQVKLWKSETDSRSAAPGEVICADKTGIVVGCGQQALRVLELQREGARRLTAEQFLAGWPLQRGQRFGEPA